MVSAQPVRSLLVETLARLHGAHRQREQQLSANIGMSSLPALKRELHFASLEVIKRRVRAASTGRPDEA